jgi:galactose-1-phosphate uridylyltransferase
VTEYLEKGDSTNKIEFEKVVREAELLSPLLNFSLVVHPIEFRKDPLTNRWCRINIERAKRVKQARVRESTDLARIVQASRGRCFFCPENLEKTTPMFPSYFPAGRIKVGSACLFPNLFPFGEFHAVGVFSEEHYLSLDQFFPELLENCFRACLEHFRFIHGKRPDIKYCMLNWNCLPPAAASIIHPHVQILADHKPTPHLSELIEASRGYHERNGSNYWLDLIEAERNGERWIGETGPVAWLTSFAPQGNGEVLAIFSDRVSSVTRMSESDLKGFCEGLSRILKGYHGMGVESFNMSLFSGPEDRDLGDHYLLHAKLVSRPNFEPFYTGDDGFMEKLHGEPIIEARPEDIAERLRGLF